MLIKFYDTLPFEEGLYYLKNTRYKTVTPCNILWVKGWLHGLPNHLAISSNDSYNGLSIYDEKLKGNLWSEKIEFDFS